ncbi:MAG: hypothetical protein RL748_1004, partial [Pseudomonadota bacterium]
MALMQFMKELAQARVKLTLDNGALSVSAPKGVATPALMAKIKEHKAALLEFLQQSERKNQAITVAERGQHPALSFAQQRLWLLDKINGGSTQYNMPAALALDGALNEAALNQALSRILERHESLRTRFAQDGDGQPFQLIATARPFKLALTDLSTLSPAMR